MKTKFLSLLLSVAVVFSGIPATNVSAAPVAFETVVEETTEEIVVEETTSEETVVEEITTEEAVVEETTTGEVVVEETTTEAAAVEETTTEAAVVEETTTEEVIVEETIAEEIVVEEIATEETVVEETFLGAQEALNVGVKAVGSNGKAYEGVVYLSLATVNALPEDAQNAYYEMCDSIAGMYEDGIDVKNVVIAADKESVAITYKVPVETLFSEAVQSSFIPEENMELFHASQGIGEDVSGAPFVETDTLMKNENFFKNQLNGNAKKIYDAGKKSIVIGGSNSLSVTFSGLFIVKMEHIDAISALVNTYPNKFNWMDLSENGGVSGGWRYYYASKKTILNLTIGKSSHYSSTLETQADAQVTKLVSAAQSYALKNYPNNHIYGMIKYFDKWICENNFYEDLGVNDGKGGTTSTYFYCHSCYGILLKGYGVCESYALAMTRLLDAVGIRNMYVVGDCGYPGSGHAWNFVEMPDGKWYLLDSTWNDSGSSSSGEYLLVPNDGHHYAKGRRFTAGSTFKYNKLAKKAYALMESEVALNASEAFIPLNKTKQLKLVTKTGYFKEFDVAWTSSNTAVATVNAKGKVTAKAPGKTTITCTVAGKTLKSTIYVYKWETLTLSTNGAANDKLECVNQDAVFDSKDVQTVKVTIGNQTGSVFTAEQLATKLNIKAPVVKSSNTKVASVDSTFSGNNVTLKISPLKVGTTKVTTSFNGKKATLTVRVSQKMDASWFDFSKVVDVEYNGKAFKPVVTLSDAGKAVKPKPTFKVTYENNKDAGTATVIVTGTGNYGGTITDTFKIAQKDASAATFNKCTASKAYNGTAQAAATTVKLGTVTLKAGKDYDVFYNGSTTVPTKVGVYTVTIKTKGNYKAFTLGEKKTYEIKTNSIKNVVVTCPTTIKAGAALNYKVKIGKNELPTSDYTVSYTDNKGNPVSASALATPGKYKLVITVKGSNVLPTATKTSITKSFTVKK